MAKAESQRRQLLIIRRLQKSPATFAGIQDYLERQSEQTGYKLTCSDRTFLRDRDEIESLHGYRISFDPSGGKYSIDGDGADVESARLLEAFETVQTLQLADGLSKYIHFETRKPQGMEHFLVLLHAIRDGKIVRFTYRKFWDDEVSVREVQPYALKEFRSRWYLLAVDEGDGRLKTFGLDRMSDLEIGKRKFVSNPEVDPAGQFRDAFGILNPAKEQPQEIVLRFGEVQGNYVKAFPLHHSQHLISETADEKRIGLKVRLTHDFLMEIFSYGGNVRVEKPARLAAMVREAHRDAAAQYGDGLTGW